jgi:nitrite reductase/ring-hydroxylating ferredoxin subunit
MSKSATNEEYVEVAKTNEITNRQMKHVEVNGKELLIANIDGKFYALNDRCAHMNALLSMGNLANDNIITCPFHGARFDIISGKKVKEPVLTFTRNGTTTKNMAKVLGTCRTTYGSY